LSSPATPAVWRSSRCEWRCYLDPLPGVHRDVTAPIEDKNVRTANEVQATVLTGTRTNCVSIACRGNAPAPSHRLWFVRTFVAIVLIALSAGGCTSSSDSPVTPRATHASSAGHWFDTPEAAIKTTCHAYWVGLVMQRTAGLERQWETKDEYRSGTGRVAKLEHATAGYRVIDCSAGRYTHG